jgi:alkylhydroperoxidase family enzyme
VLRSKFLTSEQVEAIVQDVRTAGLPSPEVAMIEFVHKLTRHAYKIVPRDIDELRSHGFTDEEILDIAAAGAARNFFSRLLDAVGAEPDPAYREVEPTLREALIVGRPLSDT